VFFLKQHFFQQALHTGEIDREVLDHLLKENKFTETPEFYLSQMENENLEELNVHHDLDRMMAKWLAAFMDEGIAEWQMPRKRRGSLQRLAKTSKIR